MEIETLNKMIDITVVNMNGGDNDIELMLELAKKYSLKSVIAHDYYIPYLKDALSGNGILIGGISGFPSGANLTDVKVFETKKLVSLGVDEIDTVINISALLSGKYDYVKKDLKAVIESAEGKTTKVIIETAFLDDEFIKRASELVAESGAEFIKTSTGFWGRPTDARIIRLIRSAVGDSCKIKAAGGVRKISAMSEMADAGASRFGIGCVSCAQILYERDLILDIDSPVPRLVSKHGFSIEEHCAY